jgi:hypothetical protein
MNENGGGGGRKKGFILTNKIETRWEKVTDLQGKT